MPGGLVSQGISSLIVVAIATALGLFWIKMLIDCATRTFTKPYYKFLWILCIAFLLVIGALIYWLAVKRRS